MSPNAIVMTKGSIVVQN